MVKNSRKKTRKPRKTTVDRRKVVEAVIIHGKSKSEAARIAGSKAKSQSAQCQAADAALNSEEAKKIASEIMLKASKHANISFDIADNVMNNESLSDEDKIKLISPLSAVTALEKAHKVYRLESDQSTENVAHKYDNMSPQELAQMMEDMINQYQ